MQITKKANAMKAANTDKAVDGNKFQDGFMEKIKNTVGDTASFQKNQKYTMTVRHFTKGTSSDIEMIFRKNTKTKIFFEVTTSIRDDRFEAKDSQAEGIIAQTTKNNLLCIYCLVVPDDYTRKFQDPDKEVRINNQFAKKVNFERRPCSDDYKFIHLLLKEHQALEFAKYLMHVDILSIDDVISCIDYCRNNILS